MKSDLETIMPNDRWVILQSLLNRNGIPVNETSMTIEVFGVYSLPEFWGKLEASGSVDSWSYQLRLGDALVADGKFNQRELTEDEKKELDNKKKPPPKIDKKNLDAVREEQERIEKLQQEKEEAKRKLKAELDALEPMQRFYRIKETPTNEAWISYEEDKAKNTVLLSGESLISIEEAINEKKGIVIQFNKVPPPDENEKKRPKPKNLNPEDIKPVYTIGWADLTDLYQTPGRTEVILRTNLILKETYEKRIANNLPIQGNQGGIGIEANQGSDAMPMTTEQQEVDYVEQAKTYVYFKICFTEAINPHQSSKDKVAPEELISIPSANKKAESTQSPNANATAEPKPITADEMCTDLRKYIKIFINSIAKSYDDSMGDNNKNSMIKRDKTAVLSNAKREERDGNITNFLYKYIENGRARPIKEKLKKFITRIALEKYKKRTNINTPFAEQKDQFYSELYAYLFDEIKLGMDEFFHLKKDELHENIISSYEQSRKEAMNYAIRQNKEPEEKRLLRLSKEYEIMGDLDKSMYYYKCRLTLIKNKDSWLNYAILAKKMNSLVEVEEAINKCIGYEGQGQALVQQGQSIGQGQQSQDEFNLKLIYSAVKWLKGRLKDAIDILLVLLNKHQLKGTNCNFNAFLAFLYKEKGNTLLYTKHYETAKRFKMIELGYKLQKPKVNPKVKTEYKRPVLPVNQCDNIWYTLIKLFNEYQFYEVSERLLEFIDPSNQNTTKYLLEYAQILLFKKENDKVIHLCDEVLKHEPDNYLAWATRGNGYHFKNNLFDSEESYVKAIRCKPQNEKFNIKMLFRLGLIYIRRKTWEDAKTVFLHILKESVYHSFAWRYLGLALTRLQDFIPAEEAINEAIILDIENPLSWSFMTFYCIDVGRTSQALQCLKEVLKMNYGNIEVLAEIAAQLYHIDEYSTAAELYEKIIRLNQRYIDGYIKLAEIYFMKYEDKKKEAINKLRNSLNYCEGEREKNSIMDFIAMYENQISNKMDNDINITSTSKINDREPGDSFNNLDHPFLNE